MNSNSKDYHNTGCQENNTTCKDGAKHLAEQLIQAIETRAQSGIGGDTTGIPKLARKHVAFTIQTVIQHVPQVSDWVKYMTDLHIEFTLDDITFVPSTSEIEKAK